MLKNYFKPDAYFKDLSMIDFDEIYAAGFRLVLLDLDNTLINHGHHTATDFSRHQIKRIIGTGLKCAILSNGVAKRVEPFAKAHKLDYIAEAIKPSRRGIWRACDRFKVDINQTILIGDQIFTDVMSGRRAGAFTILVDPLSDKEKWYIRLKRYFERIIKTKLKLKHFLPSQHRLATQSFIRSSSRQRF